MEININWISKLVFYLYKSNNIKVQMGIKEEAWCK